MHIFRCGRQGSLTFSSPGRYSYPPSFRILSKIYPSRQPLASVIHTPFLTSMTIKDSSCGRLGDSNNPSEPLVSHLGRERYRHPHRPFKHRATASASQHSPKASKL